MGAPDDRALGSTTNARPVIDPIHPLRDAFKLGPVKSETVLRERVQRGLYPKPIPLGTYERHGKRVATMGGYLESELAALNAAYVAGISEDEIRKLVVALTRKRSQAAARIAHLLEDAE